jgi:hypothetical protein
VWWEVQMVRLLQMGEEANRKKGERGGRGENVRAQGGGRGGGCGSS